jgi:hypothetical protein
MIKDIIKSAQTELDYQADDCHCFETFGGANIIIRGGVMHPDEWRDFIQDIINLIKKEYGVDYYLCNLSYENKDLILSKGGTIRLTDEEYEKLINGKLKL